MLKAKHQSENKIVFSWDSEEIDFIRKNKGDFVCPVCGSELVFIDGLEVIKHFRHKTLSNCDFEPESKEHIEMKLWLKDFLDMKKEDLEVDLGFGRPDLFDKKRKIAFEVQKSNITKKKYLERCYNYTKNGIAVMWIFHDSFLKQAEVEQNIPKLLITAQENNFGRVYMYSNKKLFVLTFGKLHKWVDEYTDYESQETYGGYLKEYKRKKVIHIIQDIPDETYGKEIYKVRTKFNGKWPSGYLVAKFYD